MAELSNRSDRIPSFNDFDALPARCAELAWLSYCFNITSIKSPSW